MFVAWILRICSLVATSGAGTNINRSNLPGRKIAGSMISGLLVAPITTTFSNDSIPSSSVRSWLMTRSETRLSPNPVPRLGTTESSSSKNMMLGAAVLPFRKTSRIAFSDSPTHLLKSSGPLIEMKFASLSVATDRASMVFPQPGGPNNRIPLGARIPTLLNTSGFFNGHSTASCNCCFTSVITPVNCRDLNVDLPHCGWRDLSVSVHEILQVDLHLLQNTTRHPFFLEVYLRKIASKRLHCSFAAESGNVSSSVAVTNVRQTREANVRREWHRSGVNLQNLVPSHFVRHSDLDLPVKPAWSPESWINSVGPVGGSNDDNVPSSAHSVHQ